jgi:hypothetical protein
MTALGLVVRVKCMEALTTKVPCLLCKVAILPTTVAKTGGFCMPCAGQRDVYELMVIARSQPGYKESISTHPTSVKVDLPGLSFANLNLTNKNITLVDFTGASFAGSLLSKTNLGWCQLNNVSFAKCTMNEARIANSSCHGASFCSASLRGLTSLHNKFRKGTFHNADLTGARFTQDDLRGASFVDAIMDDVMFDKCKYDEATSFPSSFCTFQGLEWTGKGKNPFVDVLKKRAEVKCESLEALVTELTTRLDRTRVEKSLQMLKTEAIQLYSENTEDRLFGVVKSQTDSACYLDSSGNYSCCTQNLKPCGGLKGSLCKHLLALVIGLSGAEIIKFHDALLWCLCSTLLPPQLDKEAMAQFFLKWKSAESIDWRPTETIPEDYYAY